MAINGKDNRGKEITHIDQWEARALAHFVVGSECFVH